jgi:hypothetical protein
MFGLRPTLIQKDTIGLMQTFDIGLLAHEPSTGSCLFDVLRTEQI